MIHPLDPAKVWSTSSPTKTNSNETNLTHAIKTTTKVNKHHLCSSSYAQRLIHKTAITMDNHNPKCDLL